MCVCKSSVTLSLLPGKVRKRKDKKVLKEKHENRRQRKANLKKTSKPEREQSRKQSWDLHTAIGVGSTSSIKTPGSHRERGSENTWFSHCSRTGNHTNPLTEAQPFTTQHRMLKQLSGRIPQPAETHGIGNTSSH